MRPAGEFEVIRDPLWNNIRVDREALAVLDTAAFQRLRYIRQLGHAFLVYPGATHSRFEHALGTYHLTRRALALFGERGELHALGAEDIAAVRLAALLHDIGHYPFSHALEEAGFSSHEAMARAHLAGEELQAALAASGIGRAAAVIGDLISGRSDHPLQGLISGSLDLDKIDYLTRDARMCGVPYGTVDVDRLLHSLAVVERPGGHRAIGVHEKGLSALESLLFAKYQMYRNVYWHHAVRSATAMFKRVVRWAVRQGALDAGQIPYSTDDELMVRLRDLPHPIGERLRRRRLYKRALDLGANQLPATQGAWLAGDPDLLERVEDRLAEELGRRAGEILIDFPAKPEMLAADLPILGRSGHVEQLSGARGHALLALLRIADELHTVARRLRVFVAEPTTIAPRRLLALVEQDGEELKERLARGRALLGAAT